MPISMDKYVKVKSRVGATGGVPRRELILRLFTSSTLASPSTPSEFLTADAVGEVFGVNSPEHLRAIAYFDYVSPNYTSPKKISFGRLLASASAPQVIGTAPQPVQDIKDSASYAGNTFGMSYKELGGGLNSYAIDGMDISKATSYADIAAAMQAAIRKRFSTNKYDSLKNANVAYDATRGVFVYSGKSGETISVEFSTLQWDITKTMGLFSDFSTKAGATVIAGTATTGSAEDSVAQSIAVSNNFGTYSFIDSLSIDQHLAIAKANAARNVQFEYIVPVTVANYEAWSAALTGLEGTTLVLVADTNTQFDEVLPASIKAAVDYSKRDSVVSYMYRQRDGMQALVSDTGLSNKLDSARVNYYGETQQAGIPQQFYQRGLMMGGKSSPIDQNVYANEQWLKDDIIAGFLELFLTVGRVSTNAAGINKLTNTLQESVDRATFNGTISIGKELSQKQRAFITQLTNDENAWLQVQNLGYWFVTGVEEYTASEDGRTEFKGTYTLIYSKDDNIRKVEGNNILI